MKQWTVTLKDGSYSPIAWQEDLQEHRDFARRMSDATGRYWFCRVEAGSRASAIDKALMMISVKKVGVKDAAF